MLIIQFAQSDAFDTDDDLEFRAELEEIATASLRQTHNGVCDGGDIGAGKINVFCTVKDAQAACDALVEAFAQAGLDGAIIAFVEDGEEETADPRVLWPKDFVGVFSVI